MGARYSYLDRGVENGRTYFYILEDYETTGKTARHGPVSAAPQAGSTAPAGGPAPTPASSPGPSRITYGNPDAVALRILERSEGQLLLELTTGGFFAEPLPDGSVRLSVPGFVEENAPGAPAIPTRRAWLEATVGRQVQVASIQAQDVASFSGLHPLAAEAREIVASRTGTLQPGRRRQAEGNAFRRNGLYPQQVARILETAFQGVAKKAFIELSPLRYDPRAGQLLLARRLLVRVVFGGREPSERSRGGSRGRRYADRASYRERGVLARLGTALPGAARAAEKNWKFSLADAKERGHWSDYQRAYQDLIRATASSGSRASWWRCHLRRAREAQAALPRGRAGEEEGARRRARRVLARGQGEEDGQAEGKGEPAGGFRVRRRGRQPRGPRSARVVARGRSPRQQPGSPLASRSRGGQPAAVSRPSTGRARPGRTTSADPAPPARPCPAPSSRA